MGNTGKMTLIYTEIGFLNEWPQLKLALTEVPQVNHRVSKCFKGIMQFTQTVKSYQQATKLIFPSKYSFNGLKALYENVAIEYRFSICPAIVYPIQTNNRSF